MGEIVAPRETHLLQLLSRLSGSALRRALTRLAGIDLLIHLGKGLYANSLHLPTLEEVAGLLYPPSYISLESALFVHGVIDQAPHVLTCVTLNKTKVFHTGLGDIYYYHINPKLFVGYQPSDRMLLAEPEKAALDFTYLQRQNGVLPPLDEWNWENLDWLRLRALMQAFSGTVQQHILSFMNTDDSAR